MIEDDDGEPVYQHEPEMEAAYRAEALKAFRKAAAEGKEQREPSRSARFNNAILIVDACNLRVSELLEWVHAAVGAGYQFLDGDKLGGSGCHSHEAMQQRCGAAMSGS